MSLEVKTLPEGTYKPIELGLIMPGAFGSFSDYRSNSRDIISATCLPDNSGGRVYRFANQDFPEIDQVRVIPMEIYTDDRIIAEIVWGGKFESDIVTETRRRGRLILIHSIFI